MASNPADTICFNVGGQQFVTRRATLYRLPNSRLHMIACQECSEQQERYFFDRDPEIFRFVLDYYRTGELHVPSNICGPFTRKELIFWGIPEADIQPCCLPNYMRYEEERRTKNTLFKDCFEDIAPMQSLVQMSRGWKRFRYKLWLFLDYPTSSLPAKVWAVVLLMLMITSVMCYCLQTNEAFRRSSEKLMYNATLICDAGEMSSNPKVLKDCTTEPLPGLVIVDITLNSIFTVEFLLKLLIAPDKKKFIKAFVSITDIVILSSYWIYMTLFYYYYYYSDGQRLALHNSKVPLWVLNVLAMSQALRILRIFKISKISRGLRVLMLTVKKSIPELVLLGFLLMNGMFLFSSMIYMAEYKVNDTFPDIPQAFWWSIVTLTTVGYGDTFPKGGPGYFIGSIAAISGCIVTGLAIPIVGNNFNTYYKYMQNQLKESKYLKQLNKDMITNNIGKGRNLNANRLMRGGKSKNDLPHEKIRLMNGASPSKALKTIGEA